MKSTILDEQRIASRYVRRFASTEVNPQRHNETLSQIGSKQIYKFRDKTRFGQHQRKTNADRDASQKSTEQIPYMLLRECFGEMSEIGNSIKRVDTSH